MRLVSEIAFTHIQGRLRQTIVSVAGVALGVGFSIAMAALMQGSQNDFIATLVDAIPHVQITDETREAGRQPADDAFTLVAYSGLVPRDDRRGIRNPVEVVAVLESLVPRGAVSTLLTGQAVVRFGGRDVGLAVSGIDPTREAKVARKIVAGMTSGSLEALRSAQAGIVVGDAFLKKVGAQAGDTLTVASAQGALKRFKVVGTFSTGSTGVDEGVGYVLLKSAQVLYARPNAINQIKVRIDDPLEAQTVARRIEGAIGLKTVSWQESNGDLMSAFLVRNVIMYTVVGAILLVAGFGIYNVISTIVHEKARDIAILKSLGFAETDMRRIFLLEGLIIGAMGAIAGCLMGYALSSLLASIRFEFRAGAANLDRLPILFSVWHYLIASGFALASAGFAGYLPARKAAKVKPVDIIRGAT